MTSLNTVTEYQFNFSVNGPQGESDGGFILTSLAGVTDTIALGIAKAFNGQPWPTGVTNPMTVTKQDKVFTVYTTNLTANPPSFT